MYRSNKIKVPLLHSQPEYITVMETGKLRKTIEDKKESVVKK